LVYPKAVYLGDAIFCSFSGLVLGIVHSLYRQKVEIKKDFSLTIAFLLIREEVLSKYLRSITIFFICAYGLYLRIASRAASKLWTDELFQLSTMTGSFKKLLENVVQFEFCSYLSGDYYLVYPFFKIFGYNKWGLAIPHMIATILGFYLLYIICRRYFKTTWAYIITFSIVCFNASLTYHALEIRTYAVLPTLALACLYLSLKLVDQNINMSIKKKLAIGALFVLVIWFHVYGILILLVSVLFSLLSKSRDASFKIILKDTFKFLFVVLFLAMPLWIFSVFGPHFAHILWPTFTYIPNPVKDAVGFLKAIFGNLLGYKPLYFLLAGVILPFIIPDKERFQKITFLIVMVFIPIGSLLLANIITKYWFMQRQFIWVMPFFALYLGWSWDSFICYVGEKVNRSKNV